MAWYRKVDKPPPEPMMTVYWCTYASRNLNMLKPVYTKFRYPLKRLFVEFREVLQALLKICASNVPDDPRKAPRDHNQSACQISNGCLRNPKSSMFGNICWKSNSTSTISQWNKIHYQCIGIRFNSSPPSAAYMRQWTRSSLVQVMACRQFGAKPLPELLLACQLDSIGT